MVEKVKDRAAGLISRLNPGAFLAAAADRVKGWEEKSRALLPGGIREKLPWLGGKFIFILAGLVLAVSVFSVILVLGLSGKPAADGPAAGMLRPLPIPPEDLFLPEEPDFLPPVILERERRESWTGEDAEAFWYRPLEDGEEIWREQVEKVVDDLLERVP